MKENRARRQKPVSAGIHLLKHPYPYKCSFTICNDCDYVTREAFETIHQYLNTSSDSRLGRGLGLPIADSMFMFCERPGGLSYFRGLSGVPGDHSVFLMEAVRNGWIDSLHAYGDFLSADVFSRDMAERALNELQRNNIRLKVWINHGSADDSQNFALPNVISKGDNPSHKAYHTDLLKEYGVLFAAGHNSDWIGQNGKKRYLSKSLPQSEVPFRLLKRAHGRFWGRRLLQKRRCRDHNLFYTFCRARNGVLRPDAFTLSHQLSPENVKKLIKSEGTMILYQHLGSSNKGENEFPYLDPEAREVLRNIADRYRERTIWVASTSKLLTFSYALENLRLAAGYDNEGLVITMTPGNESSGAIQLSDLRGVSFRVQNCREENLVLKYKNQTLKRTDYETFQDAGLIVRLRPGGKSWADENYPSHVL